MPSCRLTRIIWCIDLRPCLTRSLPTKDNIIGLMAFCLAQSGPSTLALINALDSAARLAASSAADAAGVGDSRSRRPFDCPYDGILEPSARLTDFSTWCILCSQNFNLMLRGRRS